MGIFVSVARMVEVRDRAFVYLRDLHLLRRIKEGRAGKKEKTKGAHKKKKDKVDKVGEVVEQPKERLKAMIPSFIRGIFNRRFHAQGHSHIDGVKRNTKTRKGKQRKQKKGGRAIEE